MLDEIPKKNSLDSTKGLPRQDILVEFMPDKEERIDVKQTEAKKERVKRDKRSL